MFCFYYLKGGDVLKKFLLFLVFFSVVLSSCVFAESNMQQSNVFSDFFNRISVTVGNFIPIEASVISDNGFRDIERIPPKPDSRAISGSIIHSTDGKIKPYPTDYELPAVPILTTANNVPSTSAFRSCKTNWDCSWFGEICIQGACVKQKPVVEPFWDSWFGQ